MWDEEIDKKIKDAADQYHPAYDDNAWNKMEQMLEKHLPRKKDRRRIIYFLPMILLLSGVIFFVILRKETIPSAKISEDTLFKNNPEKSLQENQKNSSGEIVAKLNPVKPGKKLVPGVKAGNDLSKENVNAVTRATKKIDKLTTQSRVDIINRNSQLRSENTYRDNQEKQRADKPVSVELNAKTNSIKKNSTVEPIDQTEKLPRKEIPDNNNPLQEVNNMTKDEKETIKSKEAVNVENPKNVTGNIKQKKTKKSFIQNFGITLGIGPDVSAVRLSNTGRITFNYGAGLSYSFTDKFTLRTGFYVAKKIYSAEEDDYHIPAGSPGNYNYLESVSANCKVYEIPVTLSYNFRKVKNHNWFVSAGLSSYFMKRESYVFFYKYPWGTSDHKSWSVSNRNKHYFSVLDISAGYQYSINKQFSIIAEPYLKIPLSGVGMGKIKLNSAGVLFTVAVKPF
jgi:hypothetical protein